MILSKSRMNEISDLAEFIANEYSQHGSIQPEYIALEKNISFNYGHYSDYFDGLLEHKSGSFHIYINTDRLQNPYSPRARFTFAHELGHYFIDGHRNALKNGLAPAHTSFTNFASENIVEKEADYFASCLLLPKERIEKDCFRRRFSFSLAQEIAAKYQTSITSTLLRFIALDMYPLTVVSGYKNHIKWKWNSKDFPYFKLKHGKGKVPQDTAMGEYFIDGTKYQHTETVYAEDWFDVYDKQYDRKFHEHCIYSDIRKTAVSVIWED